MTHSAEGEVAREFIGGPWNGDLRAVDEDEVLVYSHETQRTKERLLIDGVSRMVTCYQQVHFVYEWDEIDDAFVCLVAGSKADCERALARKLGED